MKPLRRLVVLNLIAVLSACPKPPPREAELKPSEDAAGAPVALGEDALGPQLIGKRVTFTGRVGSAGQAIVTAPPEYPERMDVALGGVTLPVFLKYAPALRSPDCLVRVTGTVRLDRGPVKDGSRQGRVYEPQAQYSVLAERVECAPAPAPQ